MGVELGEPPPELGELLGGQLLNLLPEILDLAHYAPRLLGVSIRPVISLGG
jgi:hypothetical protein